MSRKVTVYTTTNCGYCPMVKRWLDGRGVTYSTVNLDDNPEQQKEIYQKSGALTVPVTLVEENDMEQVVIGFNLPRLASVLK